jgi:hypothetical protein
MSVAEAPETRFQVVPRRHRPLGCLQGPEDGGELTADLLRLARAELARRRELLQIAEQASAAVARL